MEKFEVIIIGAGIAGTGLSHNLKRLGYKGKILIIDKCDLNTPRGKRNTFEEVIKEYNLPYEHKFFGVKIGVYDKTFFTLNIPFYFIDYGSTCQFLFKNSNAIFRQEIAKNIKNNILVTDKSSYSFKYLIDCSGNNFFSRKILKLNFPFRFWLGKIKDLKNKNLIDSNYFYYNFSNENYFEDFYSFKDKTIQGDWFYADKINFKLLKIHNKRFYDIYVKNPKIVREFYAAIPCSPVFPLVKNNIAFLGDSFGNATTSAAEGIRPILDSSKILANAIIKNDLKSYEIQWKKRYFKIYSKHLVSRIDRNSESKLINFFFKYPSKSSFFYSMKEYPSLAIKRLRNEDFVFPKSIIKQFPIISLIARQFIYRIYVNLKLNNI